MSNPTESAWNYVEQFRTLAQKCPGPIPDSVSFDFKGHSQHCVLTAIVHGNETGSLPGICRLINDLLESRISYQGRLTIILGNVEACRNKVRFVESDLNRAFGDIAPQTLEGRRATQIKPILATADFHLDFHQTILASDKPFWIFPYHRNGFLWAQYLNVATELVTRSPHKIFSKDGRCSDEFTRMHNKPAITLEMGQAGLNPQAEDWTYQAGARALRGLDQIANGSESIETLAPQGNEIRCHEIAFQQSFDGPKMRLLDGLINFQELNAGDSIGVLEDGSPLLCPQSGRLLFPNYPKRDESGAALKHPREIYCLIQPLNEHPDKLYGPQAHGK